MDIDGLGEQIVKTLYENKLIKNVSDLYSLKIDDLKNLERMGEKSAKNLLAAIEKSKTRPLHNLIFALGIRHVGIETAKLLAERFKNLMALTQSKKVELEEIDGIGPVVAESIQQWLERLENTAITAQLIESGLNTTHRDNTNTSKELDGIALVITGTLQTMTRNEAEEKARELGADVRKTITRKINLLVTGENPGAKLSHANALGLQIIGEEEFLDLLSNN